MRHCYGARQIGVEHGCRPGASSVTSERFVGFGGTLRRMRLAAGLTQEALAERAGISARAVSDLERDPERTPRLETVTLLADALLLDQEDRSRLLAAARPDVGATGPDSTVVETNIHHPTDSGLLTDGVPVLSRLLRRAKKILGAGTVLGMQAFRTRTRSVRRLTQRLHRVARRKGEEAAEELTETYRRLIGLAEQSTRQAIRVTAGLKERTERGAQRLAEQLEQVLLLVEQVIDQAKRRVLQGQTVPASEKLVSLFEPHSQIIKRQKPGTPVEFGRKLWLEEVEGGIVSGYRVLDEPGQDAPHLPQSLTDHQRRFGKPPWLVAGDRGVFSPANERLAEEAGVTHVVIPYAGKASATRKQRERTRWFRQGFRFRAGIDGRISVLGRCYGLDQCPEHGKAGIGRHIGWGIVTSNLAKIAETVAQGAAKAA